MSPEFWMFMNTLGLVALGLLGYLKANRTERAVNEVLDTVNGPLSAQIKHNAELTKRIAALTGDHVDAKAAADAAAVQENRAEGKAVISPTSKKE